ncbi:hypothetical protein HBH98_183800 [Parastagonospora nodorum]|nr:hypothetical protein HBH53_183390 [Parastagonospora nodorum]KAH3964168.1 hypothetical protein HBH51_162440 [Parastagonospora nodorum]KAH4053446.1 hypothetical protein HBH49_083790 [Parastagonospora nodorum]KAH4195997.1 hypothetical protein HBH42_080070 [Parastagonospora nodorum]KAH4205019.1 hypothetical protein HBI95_142580 [Parastagonospora nodorum]
MADHASNLSASASIGASATASGFFSRRPSFFSSSKGSSKGHQNKASRSSVSYSSHSYHRTNAASPPALILPPAPSSTPAPDETPHEPGQYDSNPIQPTTPHHRRHASRHSIASSVTDIGSSLRRSRSNSVRTNTSGGTASTSSHKRTPSANLALTYSPEKAPNAAASVPRPTLSISTFSRNKQKSSENVKAEGGPNTQAYEKSPLSAVDKPKTPFGMAVPMPLRHPPTQKEILQANRQANATLAPAAPIPLPNSANPNIIFQHIQELASKRISTLDYLRKAHEGRIYWFNTLLFSKADLTRLPSSTPRAQARRATHYLLLGFSLPTILDLNANSPTDYLKALNALLLEFEQYQSIHPTDGSTPSSLSRARLPQMFKRANLGGKARRSSSATGLSDYPLLTPSNSANSESSFGLDSPPENNDLLPNESYTHLQTPSLPFDPDFFSTFATLCDVLIDCYTKILSMLGTPESVSLAGGGVPSLVGDLFNKADARVRKIILAGVVREFEESCRAGLKSEVGGVGKVVLGGLM